MTADVLVVKVGGGAGVDAAAVCRDVAQLAATGQRVVLVHGTSAAADTLAARVGLPVRHLTSPSGHVSRYTDPAMLEVYVAAAAGQVNKALVGCLQAQGCNALGLSGMDGRLLLAQRKEAVRALENGRQRVVRDDYTGQLQSANGDLLRLLLDGGYIPVIAPLALGHAGEALNVDGDRVAALVASALGAARLLILSNVPGLLARFPDENSLVRHVPSMGLEAAEQMAQGRMKKKVLAAREALAGGVRQVLLADSRQPQPIVAALRGQGTALGEAHTGSGAPLAWALPAPGTLSASWALTGQGGQR
jgi:[amino group carrier protein]-L-2-aminoadipate 6-kinase